ncbi:hypothetical protein J5N97_023386 [Dioscorea zingiberensis]|uniref:Uncharacterized protein n=1 Tax=Dioscorea zingiberensis TaxID=325984 RepID=A0A9D5CCQ8_9LILI|nr:hypothetical protein J5N97_023386 [Dioscorea zingiberensis]
MQATTSRPAPLFAALCWRRPAAQPAQIRPPPLWPPIRAPQPQQRPATTTREPRLWLLPSCQLYSDRHSRAPVPGQLRHGRRRRLCWCRQPPPSLGAAPRRTTALASAPFSRRLSFNEHRTLFSGVLQGSRANQDGVATTLIPGESNAHMND